MSLCRLSAARGMASIGSLLDQVTHETPLKETLQYPTGKEKWTRADVKVRRPGPSAPMLPEGWGLTGNGVAAGSRWAGGGAPGPGPAARRHHSGLARPR
jgi:hypothetical protein